MYQPGYQFWHPMLHPNAMKVREPLRIVRGEGCYVFDDAGNKLVDGPACGTSTWAMAAARSSGRWPPSSTNWRIFPSSTA